MAAELEWDGGSARIEALGGMIAPLRLRLSDGRTVEPLAIAPWTGAELPEGAPGILRGLRGDFPCLPFGGGDPGPLAGDWAGLPHGADGPPHGHSSNADWDVSERDGALFGRIVYPEDSPVAELTQELRPAGAGRVEMALMVRVRRDCRLPMALHPIFRLSEEIGGTQLDLGRHGAIRVHPTLSGEDPCPLLPDGSSDELSDLPGKDGTVRDYGRLPLAEPVESRLLVTRAGGAVTLRHRPEDWSVRLSWDSAILPNVMLWVSNRGRQQTPWHGRHLALGIEPCAAAFDIGRAASIADNPLTREGLTTAVRFRAAEPLVLRHAIEVRAGTS